MVAVTRNFLFVFCLLLSLITVHAKPPAGYKLAWADEFDGPALDTNKWSHRQLGVREDAINTADAVSISNGCLTITSYTVGKKHFTGMVSTAGLFEPIHGYWEARIKFQDMPGQWSAFWLQTPTMANPLGDPGKAGTEIDICEHRVVDKGGTNIADKVRQTLHWDGYGKHHKSEGRFSPAMNLDQGFHLFGCEVTSAGYKFFIDDHLTAETHTAASNAKEFAILSSEIKNGGWAGKIPQDGYGDRATSQVKMIVDYVRYYTQP